MTCSNLQQS